MSGYDGTFIVGAPRSGTTLLQSLVAAHSMYYSMPETSFFLSILPRLGITYNCPDAELSPGDIDTIRSEFRYMTGRNLPSLTLESDTIDVRAFFRKIMQAFNSDNKPRWVEKTTNHARSMMAIRRFFPQARFVHIIRDPVDSVASMKSIRPTSWSDCRITYISSYRESARVWASCVEAALRYPEPEKVFHMHYEDLLAEPEKQLRRLFEFLGAPYEDGILETYARQAENGSMMSRTIHGRRARRFQAYGRLTGTNGAIVYRTAACGSSSTIRRSLRAISDILMRGFACDQSPAWRRWPRTVLFISWPVAASSSRYVTSAGEVNNERGSGIYQDGGSFARGHRVSRFFEGRDSFFHA